MQQLISYIAPGAPATRQPANGDEPYLRPEIGFTPKWYRDALVIDFSKRWHTDVEYRMESLSRMRAELDRRFPGARIGRARNHAGIDWLTGVHGACAIAGIYGCPIVYHEDQWPVAVAEPLSDRQVIELLPPNLDENPFFQSLMAQVDCIAERQGIVTGYVNWQGVLNNAHRLRGEELFTDLLTAPDLCHHLFECVCTTMIDAARRLHARQRETGFEVSFFTVSNCLVNLVSPEIYREFLLPYDRRIADAFSTIGVHNCAWTVDPYIANYASLPNLSYVDMGLESDLCSAREPMPQARRAVMYRPTELADKPLCDIESDLKRICHELGPCDIVAADIESGTPDERVIALITMCQELSESAAKSSENV